MTNLTDTHAHLYAEQFDEDRDAMMERAMEAGVRRFYLPNIDSTSIEPMLELVRNYSEHCFPMMGLHPCSVNKNFEKELQIVEKWLHEAQFYAVGEIGLDFYWDKTFEAQQREAFKIQVEWAKEQKLPVVIHSRDSFHAIADMLEPMKDERLRGVFHCFTGTKEDAQRAINLGFKLGIGGVVTFKNSGLDKTLEDIDPEHLVLETDAPYLAPVPYRGKRNESAYLINIAEKVAEIKNTSVEEIAEITTQNAIRLFGG